MAAMLNFFSSYTFFAAQIFSNSLSISRLLFPFQLKFAQELILYLKKFTFSRSKKSKRSKSRERKHSHRRSRSRSRSSSGERRHRRREERYEREQREEREREEREKEMERDRLRQIALEFKQSGAFSSIATQSQSFQNPFQQNLPTIPLLSSLSSFPTFTSFPMMNTHVAPVVELQPQPQPPKEKSQAFLEAIAASQRIAASKNFNEIFTCSNSNDSTSNGPTYNSGSNSSE